MSTRETTKGDTKANRTVRNTVMNYYEQWGNREGSWGRGGVARLHCVPSWRDTLLIDSILIHLTYSAYTP